MVTDPTPTDSYVVHYLPQSAVLRQGKATTKIRIVYDESAKKTGLSLHGCLYIGLKFDQRITDIQVSLKTLRISLTANIERAFLQICVEE